MWFDGAKVLEKDGLTLWTGKCYTKYGIYRGERGTMMRRGKAMCLIALFMGCRLVMRVWPRSQNTVGWGSKSRIKSGCTIIIDETYSA